ncbi:MAG TPA: 1-acyl-sn-glycerol-3-phosphate acyltransferase [Salinivirgaceae bacterium]|nr:1-acyl-sn-glycerol-3-phosphate acyltransferase [Salinivirgaceae bacterium]
MGKHNIEKYSIPFRLLLHWGKPFHDCLYSRVHVFNKPKKIKHPHIYASNHQNALMDAIALIFAVNRMQVFLARSDIFKKPFIAAMLYQIKILPIFRIRDGFENLKNNDEVFENSVRVLNYPRTLSMFAEGSHAGYKHLRPLQKGFARIAFQAIEDRDNSGPFYIVPIGLEYEHYEKFGTEQIVNFGEPFEISEYYETYKESPAQGLTDLRDRLSEEIKKLIIHIDSKKWYYLILRLTDWNRTMLRGKNEKALNIFKSNQKLASKLSGLEDDDKGATELEQKCQTLDKLLVRSKLNVNEIATKNNILKNILILAICLPLLVISLPALALFGWIFFLVRDIVNKKIKDPQFRTSVRFAIYIILSILFAFIISLLALFLISWKAYLISLVAIVVTSVIGLKIVPFYKKIILRLKTGILHLFGHKRTKEIINLRDEIFEQIIHINR